MRDLSEEDARVKTRQMAGLIRAFVESAQLGTLIPVHHHRFVILCSLPQDSFLSLLDEPD